MVLFAFVGNIDGTGEDLCIVLIKIHPLEATSDVCVESGAASGIDCEIFLSNRACISRPGRVFCPDKRYCPSRDWNIQKSESFPL